MTVFHRADRMWIACVVASACLWLSCGDSDPGSAEADAGVEQGAGEPFTDGSRCTCAEGGVCVNQSGGPGEPVGLHCGSWIPDQCESDDPCPCVVNEGECDPDPYVGGLCWCDNGTV